MPTYVYECLACGARCEVFHGMAEAPSVKCASCGGSVRRLITGGGGVIARNRSGSREGCARETTGRSCCGRKEPCGDRRCGG